MLDPASALFERGAPQHKTMREDIRAVVYRYARGLPPDVPIVVTDALADTDADRALFAPTQALAAARRAPLHAVTLRLTQEENLRRLTHQARADRSKLTRADILMQLRRENTLLQPPGAVDVDVTDLSAEDAASEIAQLLKLSLRGCDA